MESIDVAIIGAGITGLSAAWRLALAGRGVSVFEQHEIGNVHGSSHGAVRIFRFAYPDPFYVRLAQASLPLWRDLETHPGDIVRITGGIDAGSPDHIDPVADALASCGAHAETITAAERERRFPWLAAGDAGAVFSPDTGIINAHQALKRASDAARSSGVRILANTTVRGLEPSADDVAVHSDNGTYRAHTVVVAAGAWSAPLLSSIGISVPLHVTREQVMYFRPRIGRELPELPFIHYGDIIRYGLPGGSHGYKVGEHHTGRDTTPGSQAQLAEPEAGRLREYVTSALPDLHPREAGWDPCLYTSTPSQDFVLDVRGHVVVASPCSGHGFKFGPLTGEIIACLAAGKPPPVDVSRFALAAFS